MRDRPFEQWQALLRRQPNLNRTHRPIIQRRLNSPGSRRERLGGEVVHIVTAAVAEQVAAICAAGWCGVYRITHRVSAVEFLE